MFSDGRGIALIDRHSGKEIQSEENEENSENRS